MLIIRARGLKDEILLVKKKESIKALVMKCTHHGVALDVKPNFIHCPAHGSAFDFDGNVINLPAKKPLASFPVVVEGDHVVLQVTL